MALVPEIGTLGIWTGALWAAPEEAPKIAETLDQLGYGAVWIPNRPDLFSRVEQMLGASSRLVVATGIASIWDHQAEEVARAHADLSARYGRRFLLGLGVSHAALVNRQEEGRYAKPVEHMLAYLDALDAAPQPVGREDRVLAALGPRMLGIARDRTAGAHPYLVTAEHTAFARTELGVGPLLAPEQAVVLETDAATARAIARKHLETYLQAPNYLNNWRRLGFTEDDFASGGSDRLVDALVAWGDLAAVEERIVAHLQAGADHVCVQALTAGSQPPYAEWKTLARLLGTLRR